MGHLSEPDGGQFLLSNFVKITFQFFLSTDFVLTKFYKSICKDVLLTDNLVTYMTCDLVLALIAVNVFILY